MKHFMCPVNQNYSLCGIRVPDEEMTSDIKEKDVCGNCRRTKYYLNLQKLNEETKVKESSMFNNWKKHTSTDCKYPQIKEACLKKSPFTVRVTPEQSEVVQKIAFDCGIGWTSGSPYQIMHKDKPFLCFLKNVCGDFAMFYEYKKQSLNEIILNEKPTISTNCKYPNLRKAIQERRNIKMQVTPKQSAEVQRIAFECDVYWCCGESRSKWLEFPFLYICSDAIFPYGILRGAELGYFSCAKEDEFSLEHDCFVSEIGKCEIHVEQNMDCKVKQLIQTIEESLKELKVLLK